MAVQDFVGLARRRPAARLDRSLRALVSACCLVLLAACSGCGTDEPLIIEVHGDPESTRLSVGINTCNMHPSVAAEETTEEVHLAVTADEPSGNGRDDCADSDDVRLDTPLGDRIVIDDSTGEQVEVAPLED